MSSNVPVTELFSEALAHRTSLTSGERLLIDDLKLSSDSLSSSLFTSAEEMFAFGRATSRLMEMQSEEVKSLVVDNI